MKFHFRNILDDVEWLSRYVSNIEHLRRSTNNAALFPETSLHFASFSSLCFEDFCSFKYYIKF